MRESTLLNRDNQCAIASGKFTGTICTLCIYHNIFYFSQSLLLVQSL